MGRTGLIAVFVGVFLGGAAAPAPVTTISQVLAALDRGDAQQAGSLSGSALSQQEAMDAHTRASLLLYHGLASELLGGHDAALRDLTQAIDIKALSSEELGQAYLQRGFLREGLGQMDEAVSDYAAVIALKGYSTATAFNNRGNIYLRRNRLMDAQADYLAALAADGGQSQYSYYGLGRIAEIEGDKQAARGFYTKAVAIDPGYAVASQRVMQLGGTGSTAVPVSSTAPIVLRPPPVREASADTRNSGDAIILRPPQRPEGPVAPVALPAVPPLPHLLQVNAMLRPALDQSDIRAAVRHGEEVQLGAWRSAAEAHAAWDKARSRAGDVLEGVSPDILAADVPGKGRYFRLRVRPEFGESGTQMCARLAARALDCFPVRD